VRRNKIGFSVLYYTHLNTSTGPLQVPPSFSTIRDAFFSEKELSQGCAQKYGKIMKLQPLKPLSSHTINKYLSRLSNLFSYAVTHGYMNMNPAGSLKVQLKSRPDEEHQTYTTEDLKKLFREPETHSKGD
jgi:site-specific recombinase XerD